MRQHKHEGCSVREHRNTCAKHSTRARARKSLQAQLAAGRGPGVGARSPCPQGPRAARAARRERAGSAHTAGGCMRQHTQTGGCVRQHKTTCAERSTRAQRAKACKLSLPRVGVRG